MVKHLTVRFAWHDNKWNGKICREPEQNVYCTGNYSLLSPRIQRRIDLDIEKKCTNQTVPKVVKEHEYLPPCYWCINALGNRKISIEDPHPFADNRILGERFRNEVSPLRETLEKNSVFTWCFKLGFEDEETLERYPPPEVLEKRVENYLGEIQSGRSIAFFYANYSNPITGDDYKYLLLGAGLVKDSKKPQKYNIPSDLLNSVRSRKGMRNFPKLAWQFQIVLEPNSVFVLPYHEYLEWIYKEDEIETKTKWKKLNEVAISINESTIIPHFKYVSMLLTHDKAIYLLYSILKSLRKMKEHGIVEYSQIDEMEKKAQELLKIAWKERGQHPSFRNVLFVTLSNDFSPNVLKSLLPNVEEYIYENFGSVDKFFTSIDKGIGYENMSKKIRKVFRLLSRKMELVNFLSLFDFTIPQFKNIEEIVNQMGLGTIKKNPYVLLEKYHYDWLDSYDVDESDYGIGLYQFDIALIPDLEYVDWDTPYDAQSPERLRAVITKILRDSATGEGNSCLSREEIVERIKEYPLYYIGEKLKIDIFKLAEYEKQPIFKEKFIIKKDFKEKQEIYQLLEIREVERIIEDFIGKMLKKKYTVDTKDVELILEGERNRFGEKIDIDERKRLYINCLKHGLFVLTGKAGSGKTTAVINLIKKFYEDRKLPIFVFTPTGKANLVIRNRLKKFNLHKENTIRISTIHRFLYGGLFSFIRFTPRRGEIFRLANLISKILDGRWELLHEYRSLAKNWQFNPKVIIIDEASMIDEVLLATLFTLVNPYMLEHLIIVGDENQLPPIGVGRPLVDTLFYLKKKWLNDNVIHLESNLRFEPASQLGILSELFSGKNRPAPMEIAWAIEHSDSTLGKHYFSNLDELKDMTKRILCEVGSSDEKKSIFEMFREVFENDDELTLDKVQFISPRRVGRFGSWTINRNVVLNGDVRFAPKTKLICEKNIYFSVKGKRVLGLANGSIGFIKKERYIHFDDIPELIQDYGYDIVYRGLISKIQTDVYSVLKTEKTIDFGYAITVHKAQGSDFDHVILVLSEVSPFITRELLYTAFTRPRTKLHFLIHSNLKDELPLILSNAYENSSVDQRKTLLFGYKSSPFRPYTLVLNDKRVLEVRSKIEYIIAKTLEELGIDFEYEPKDFLREYHVKPDFKFFINNEAYYLEHLGIMTDVGYRERWIHKFEIYKKIGIVDRLITTSEKQEKSDVENNLKRIIDDIKSNKLRKTDGGYSKHHYYI